MSSAVKIKPASFRYLLAKVMNAGVESLYQFASIRQQSGTKQQVALSEAVSTALAKFRAAYGQRLTTVMYMAGAAMAPTLNKRALEDPSEIEKLVVRLLPRPTARSVLVGDVVAFSSPLALGQAAKQAVMVRRVAALEGTEMVSADAEDEAFAIPKDHLWVLGDNEKLKPPDIIDSRTFGAVPMQNIIGRVIYAARSASDHSQVVNHPMSMLNDEPIIEQEVDVDQLWPASASSSSGGDGRSSRNSSSDGNQP